MTIVVPVITVTDIKARTESMAIATLASEGFLERRLYIAFLVESFSHRSGFRRYEYYHVNLLNNI